ncbi:MULTISPECIES: polysaccharide biosynthesis protein [unclassified Gemella]|uniref:putative polysaccharide biosynthesis protein n=1 Tax=unclassified Gemella TaxID=2624949 RepID=UPI001C04AE5F|nr:MULTISPECIES: polysaccharide biosynthesis protein [unclassified Gemella]MBU0278797.1 polysaccharide biosynthesis protein [Gemella sp. zg-1178]QWQ39347.1 polysaccharide biosynthesis protein [Gemella sp. zg-570]
MKKDSLFKGTFILSLSLILTKLIGLIYIIPYYSIVGGKPNMILINYAYNYYVLLLELSAAGIPLAISKLISKYNEIGNFEKSKRIAKTGSSILLVFGIIGFFIFIFGAKYMAAYTISTVDVPLRYTVEDLELVIQTLSLAVPFVMINGGLRGIFQGHEIMLPSAISQFFEQVFRIAVMMLGTYIVMQITKGNVVYANAMATFASGIGAIIAVLILLYYYVRFKNNLDFNNYNDIVYKKEKTVSIIKEIFSVSVPFVIVSSFFSILTLIDQNTIIPAMDILGKAQIGEDQFNVYNNYINKLVMISVSLAPALTGAFLPAITRLYVNKKTDEVSIQINKVILALLMIVMPSLFGMYILTEPIYVSFYEFDLEAFYLMRIYIPLALFYSVYGITSIIMQAIDKQRINIYTIIVGVCFKFFLNEKFILHFETEGAIYCSILTYILMIFLNFVVIEYEIGLRIREFAKNFIKILISCFIMSFVILAIYDSIISNFNIHFKIDSSILVAICAVFGVVIYFVVLSKSKFVRYLFGKNINLKTILRRG